MAGTQGLKLPPDGPSGTAPASAKPAPSALEGWLVLGLRQAVITATTFVGLVALGRLLGPQDFALYGYTTIGVTLALAVGDLGLAARLIRDEDPDAVARAAFGAQLTGLGVLAAVAVCAGFALPPDDRLPLALIAVAMGLAALQTLPTAVLERRLSFGRISQVEVVQRLSLVVVAVTLAAVGTERLAVPVAGCVAGLLGYAGVLLAARWRVRPTLRGARAAVGGFASEWWQGRVATQIAYAAYPALGGLLLGAVDASHLVLALTITSFSTLLAPLVARATFPIITGSDVASGIEAFRHVFKAFFVTSVPVLAILAVCGGPIVEVLFGREWLDAVPVLRLICVATLVGIVLTPSLPLLYHVLDPAFVKRALVGWCIAQWVLTPPAIALMGVVAVPIVGTIVSATSVLVLDRRCARTTGFSLVREALPAVAAAVPGALAGSAILLLGDDPLLGVPAAFAVVLPFLVLMRRSLLESAQAIRATLARRST